MKSWFLLVDGRQATVDNVGKGVKWLNKRPFAKSESLAQQAYRYLRNEILVGHMAPGSKLIESRLAKEWQVSRSPLREAIRKLEQEGLLQTHGGETRVFQPTMKDFKDLYQLRLELEPLAARLATRNINDDKLSPLCTALEEADKYLKSDDISAFLEHSGIFHHLIAEFSGNNRLTQVVTATVTMLRYYRYIFLKMFHGYSNSAASHWCIYHAMEERDEESAWEEMRRHVTAEFQSVESVRNQIDGM